MSEELIQTKPQKIGKFTYYKLGNTTLNQLKINGIVPKKDYGKLNNKKPDGLILYQNKVIAMVEYKLPNKLKTKKDIEIAIKQEIDVAKLLCKILIITDNTKSFWINALNGETIRDSSGNLIKEIFNPISVKNIGTIEYLIDEINNSISESISSIRSAKLIDPTPLATRLWQTIWVATGKSPVKCLYNVVELFIFKFLSDLDILHDDLSFDYVYKKSQNNPAEALEYYAKNSRDKIYKLFPNGVDGTTIINGTIFVNDMGEANLSQSILFFRSLDHLHKYSEEFGSLTKIDKQFKTKLFESFLNQEVEALGQYLTPRVIIQSIIRMAKINESSFQYVGKRFCDPFCGVGGFPLEMLNMNDNMMLCYKPDNNGNINLPFVMNGFDKGFERDDERTIILAKANMLIYLAELLFSNPQTTLEFARIFNETFSLFRDNLGTFGYIISEDDEKYDFILTNPPYVTSGSGIIKEEINKTPRTRNKYSISSLGLEGLSIQWIIRSLNPGGKAYIIIPDGILTRVHGKYLRNHILSKCYLDALISLPVRTFFANYKHTYILAITKKNNMDDEQKDPVFTYIVSDIGEQLTSVKREEIIENDLPEMELLFHIFIGSRKNSKQIVEKQSKRCKIQEIKKFKESTHWVIDRWWSREERIELGIEETSEDVSKVELDALLDGLDAEIEEYDNLIKQEYPIPINYKKVSLGQKELFLLFIGKRVLKNDLPEKVGKIPLFSANVVNPFGFISESNVNSFIYPSVLWGIDGNFEFNFIEPKKPFATTDHCGTIQILNENILPEYLIFALEQKKIEENFDRSFRASLSNMERFEIKIPINENGDFDVKLQKEMASLYHSKKKKREQIINLKKNLDDVFINYLTE